MEIKRQHIRFPADFGTFIFIDSNSDHLSKEIEFDFSGLVIDEAYKGCSFVLPVNTKSSILKVGRLIWIQIGDRLPVQSFVRWIKEIDPKVAMIGIEFKN